jgi:transposase-like protein
LQQKCPRCGSDAFNSYGYTRNGKRRYLCLVCGRQFVEGAMKIFSRRPMCPRCHSAMHVYAHEAEAVRFRCSKYPSCKGYVKVNKENLRP